jgi:hypothetical protein
MTFSLLRDHLTPAEGETAVRSYHCTSLSSRLLSLKAEGHLTVTNKRVVFYAAGSSYGGKSVLHSEVPIADVSGINSYKGTYFSLSHLLAALVVSFILGNVAAVIISGIILASLRNSFDFSSAQTTFLVLAIAAVGGSFFIPRNRIWRSVVATCGAALLIGVGGISIIGSVLGSLLGGGGGWRVLLGVAAAIYALMCMFWYARRETISLAVGSKGGSSTPIAISGISSMGLYNTAAQRALSAAPAQDAEAMIRELGAMVTDIQALGDFGIHKWTVAQVGSVSAPAPAPAMMGD